MDFTYQTLQRIYKKGAIPLLSLTISLPRLSGDEESYEKINRFYREMEEGLVRITEEKLYPPLLARYEAAKSRRERFSGSPYRLSLSAVCTQEKEGTLLCERRLTLSYRGRVIKERISRETISSNGLLLPLRTPKKRGTKENSEKPKKEKARE